MDIDLEGKIRSRIEAVLINDARNYDEMRTVATEEDPLENDPFAEERNLYQRIISSYRSAVSEVNGLLEENVGFLSGFYRIIETIKDKENFQEICSQIVECVLQDLGAEYCSLVFHPKEGPEGEPHCLEGIREQRKFVCSHSHSTLLNSKEFDEVVARLMNGAADCDNIGDVYREPRFDRIDFPSVIRSLVCLPIRVRQACVGSLILGHSLPHFFTDNHTRVLKILASTIAHLWLLTSQRAVCVPAQPSSHPQPCGEESEETLSIVLLNFESDGPARRLLTDRETIRSIRSPLARTLDGKESILLYDDAELLVLLPGTTAEMLATRTARLREAFEDWKAAQGERAQFIRLNLGFSTCEGGEDLARTLKMASLMMRADPDEYDFNQAEPDLQPH